MIKTSYHFVSTICILLLTLSGSANLSSQNIHSKSLDYMKIFVTKNENRSVSFTNKKSAFYYTQTHLANHLEYSWFEGFNISQNRIFSGYNLFADNNKLNTENSKVWVFPYKLLRDYPNNIKEELWMFDNKDILEINVEGASNSIGIELKGDKVTYLGTNNNIAYFSSIEGNYFIAVSSINNQPIKFENQRVMSNSKANGFYIAAEKSKKEAKALIDKLRKNDKKYKEERIHRMENFLKQNVYIKSNCDSLDLALNWLELNMNQLITDQRGEGIYAGLPWFNEYWGRDEFISLPGATLVSGQFDTARKILLSFAKFQNTDTNSIFFGRVPNIVKTGAIDYHTTDGTPRFIIGLQDYVKYSGDTSLIRQIYPTVKNSIEGALKNWTDEKGYLTHKDNETWMDARDKNLKSYSPRDNRANDIEALWYNQLCAGSYFAAFMHDEKNRVKWTNLSEKIKHNFENDYRDSSHDYLADRLKNDNTADFTLRPNQLFTFDLLSDTTFRNNALQKVWSELVYPWGVATLDKSNSFFHPYHLCQDYPKDEAYHNGTVWPWLNGIAMQRMIEAGQTETAYQLFKNSNTEAIKRDVVGGLGENFNAFTHVGQKWATATGAYLQAWSIAEQLRVWYQYFLGIRPNIPDKTLTLAPRIPDEITSLQYHFIIGKDLINASYSSAEKKVYKYQFNNENLSLVVDILPFDIVKIDIEANQMLQIEQTKNTLKILITDKDGKMITSIQKMKSSIIEKEIEDANAILKDVKFAEPNLENYPEVKTIDSK